MDFGYLASLVLEKSRLINIFNLINPMPNVRNEYGYLQYSTCKYDYLLMNRLYVPYEVSYLYLRKLGIPNCKDDLANANQFDDVHRLYWN